MELVTSARLRRGAGAGLVVAALLALAPRLAVASAWGSPYGDPAGFCPAHSWLPWTYLSLPPTNDPLVGNNPEQDTFFGYHRYPGYDDWYGYWYGDFRGRPGDASGWQLIRRVDYPSRWHWNFGDWGWAVHGHAKTSPSTSTRVRARPPARKIACLRSMWGG